MESNRLPNPRTAEEAVQQGVQRLDHFSDRTWRAQVRSARRKSSVVLPNACTLARIYRSYRTGLAALHIPDGEGWRFGFDEHNDPKSGSHFTYAALDAAWNRELALS